MLHGLCVPPPPVAFLYRIEACVDDATIKDQPTNKKPLAAAVLDELVDGHGAIAKHNMNRKGHTQYNNQYEDIYIPSRM